MPRFAADTLHVLPACSVQRPGSRPQSWSLGPGHAPLQIPRWRELTPLCWSLGTRRGAVRRRGDRSSITFQRQSWPCALPPAGLQQASSEPPAGLQRASSGSPAGLQRASSGPPAGLQRASSGPPANLQRASSGPPAGLQQNDWQREGRSRTLGDHFQPPRSGETQASHSLFVTDGRLHFSKLTGPPQICLNLSNAFSLPN